MNKDEILKLLEKVPTSISQIEVNLGIPKTSLQKAVKGERNLPKKWWLKLTEAYPSTTVIQDLTKPTNEIKPAEQPTTNFTINTLKDIAKGEEIKPTGLKFKNRNKLSPEKEAVKQPENDRPEPPSHLKGIDLTIWKSENWK